MERRLNQGSATNGISSLTDVYINAQKIGEIRINGDNQEIMIPAELLIPNSENQITVKTGRNLLSKKAWIMTTLNLLILLLNLNNFLNL
ncbi:MAG: hypothetical protein MZU97_01795 [Bacillus subtilis]|nr:hypothetical protein [Bacillus subtilis]